MSELQEKQFPILDFVGLWLIVLFGFLATPDISMSIRIMLIALGSIGVILFGLFYKNYLKAKLPKAHFIQKRLNELGELEATKSLPESKAVPSTQRGAFIIWFDDSIILFFFGVYNWEFVSINNIAIVTYKDLFSILYLTGGVFSLVFSIWLFRKKY